MARAARLSLAFLLAASVVLLTSTPCAACSCASEPLSGLLAASDVAFTGEVVSRRPAGQGTIQVLRVDEVYVGALGPRVELYAEIGPQMVSSCALLLPTQTRVAVLADRNADGTFSTSVCAMTTVRALRKAAGEPHPPDPAIGLPEPTVPGGEGDGGSGAGVALAGVLLVAGLLAASLVFGRRRASDRWHERAHDDHPEAGDGKEARDPGDPAALTALRRDEQHPDEEGELVPGEQDEAPPESPDPG